MTKFSAIVETLSRAGVRSATRRRTFDTRDEATREGERMFSAAVGNLDNVEIDLTVEEMGLFNVEVHSNDWRRTK